MNSPVIRSRNVLKRNSMRFAAALLAALASLVVGANAVLVCAPQNHDQVPAPAMVPIIAKEGIDGMKARTCC